MMESVRRELGRLVFGKALSVLLGLLVLTLLWRRVTPSAYGQYLSLLAWAEILSLISALGLSTVAQRHLPIWMAHAQTPWHAWSRVAQILLLRILLAGFFIVLTLMLASAFRLPWRDFAAPFGMTPALALVMATVVMRSLEEIQSVLLMQTWIQAMAVVAHLVRLLALSTLEGGAAADLNWLMRLELSIAGATLLVGLVTTASRSRRRTEPQEPLLNEPPSGWIVAWRRSLQFWLIQCLGLAWSLHALRLMLHAVGGPSAVALHSVAFSMVESLRQATPLVWMTGWLRAAMLRLHTERPNSRASLALASAVHRLSLLILWPVVCAWCTEPAAWLRWVGGSEMFSLAQDLSRQHPAVPAFTGLLAATAGLAPLQNRHLLISLGAVVQQQPGWGVPASLAAALSVLSFWSLYPTWGLWSVPIVMLLAEILWVATASLGRNGAWFEPWGGWRSLRVPLTAITAAGLASLALDQFSGAQEVLRLSLPLVSALVAVALLTGMKSMWSTEERQALLRCLPIGLIALRSRWMREPSR